MCQALGMTASTLTGKQRRHLRALGHHLEPVIHVGKNGSVAAVEATHRALLDHELIKVRVGAECPEDRLEVAELLATKPEELVRRAVKGMLPKNVLGREMLTKLKVYATPDHPHAAQKPQPLTVNI